MKLKTLREAVEKAISTAGIAEKLFWGASLGLSVAAFAAARLASGQGEGQFAAWSGWASMVTELVAGVAILASLGWAIARIIWCYNPAQGVVRHLTEQDEAGVFAQDFEAYLARGEMRFDTGAYYWPKTERDRRVLSRLNAACFSSSMNYGGSYAEKKQRNDSLIDKNPQTFCLVGSDGDAVGFTSVIPLLPAFYALYRQGKISDHDFVAEMIAGPNDTVGGLVLFAIGLAPEIENGPASGRARMIRILLRGLIFHLDSLASTAPAEQADDLPLIVQAEKLSIIRALNKWGFDTLDVKGGDGDQLFETSRGQLRHILSAMSSHPAA